MESRPVPILLSPRWRFTLIAGFVIVAAGLRTAGFFTDFWFDEIWSWALLPKLHSVSDILLLEAARIDNNHALNTLWMYLLGPKAPVWLYRLPSLLAGIGAVLVAGHLMARRSWRAGMFAVLLMAFSYPMVFYSSEARGYSPVVFFALLSLDALDLACLARQSSQRATVAIVAFNVAAVLGFFSHLTFLYAYLAALTVSVLHVLRYRKRRAGRIGWLCRLHIVPILAVLVLYFAYARHMTIGGAAPTSPVEIVIASLSLTFGGPRTGMAAMCVGSIGALVLVASAVSPLRRLDTLGVYSFIAALLAPLLICGQEQFLSKHPQPLMVRYFLVCLAVAIMPVAGLLDRLWQRNTPARVAVLVALAFFIGGNLWQLSEFYRDGRGHYSDALERILHDDPSNLVRIGSDNPIRTQCLLEFFAPRLLHHRGMELGTGPAPWLILNRESLDAEPTMMFQDHDYALVEVYRFNGLSGWCWYLYRQRDH